MFYSSRLLHYFGSGLVYDRGFATAKVKAQEYSIRPEPTDTGRRELKIAGRRVKQRYRAEALKLQAKALHIAMELPFLFGVF